MLHVVQTLGYWNTPDSLQNGSNRCSKPLVSRLHLARHALMHKTVMVSPLLRCFPSFNKYDISMFLPHLSDAVAV